MRRPDVPDQSSARPPRPPRIPGRSPQYAHSGRIPPRAGTIGEKSLPPRPGGAHLNRRRRSCRSVRHHCRHPARYCREDACRTAGDQVTGPGGTVSAGPPGVASEPLAPFDPTKPNIARAYDCLLGGKDHFSPDRELAERLVALYPGVRQMVRENRRFLVRALDYVAAQGISQYADLGAGLPTSPAVHEVVRRHDRTASVVYVDNDPVVISHLRALAAKGDDHIDAVAGDVAKATAVLDAVQATGLIDLGKPVCLIAAMVLHFLDAVNGPPGHRRLHRQAGSRFPCHHHGRLRGPGHRRADHPHLQRRLGVQPHRRGCGVLLHRPGADQAWCRGRPRIKARAGRLPPRSRSVRGKSWPGSGSNDDRAAAGDADVADVPVGRPVSHLLRPGPVGGAAPRRHPVPDR